MTDKNSQLRKLFLENPTLSNMELEKKWEEEGHEKIPSVDFRKCRSQLRQKLYGDLPLTAQGQVSKSGVVVRFFENKPNWNDTKISEYLTAFGITVSRNSVSAIRSTYKKKKAGISVRVTKKTKKNASERGSRSQAIRDFIAENPGSSPKVIVEGLAAKGIKVSLGLASVIRYSKKNKKGHKGVSPDPRQNSGHRARKSESGSPTSLLEIEETLDSLISAAQQYGNSKIVEKLRNTRREVSAEILMN